MLWYVNFTTIKKKNSQSQVIPDWRKEDPTGHKSWEGRILVEIIFGDQLPQQLLDVSSLKGGSSVSCGWIQSLPLF